MLLSPQRLQGSGEFFVGSRHGFKLLLSCDYRRIMLRAYKRIEAWADGINKLRMRYPSRQDPALGGSDGQRDHRTE